MSEQWVVDREESSRREMERKGVRGIYTLVLDTQCKLIELNSVVWVMRKLDIPRCLRNKDVS